MIRFLGGLSLFIIIMVFAACSSKEEAEVAPETDVQTQSQLPANHPPVSGTEIKYSAPQGWIAETPSGSMRKAQYKLPGVEGKDPAELAVFHFPGTGGSVEANLSRWYGQFKQPAGGSTQERAETKSVMATELPVTIVYTTGTYLKSSSPMSMGGPVEELPGYALLAAIVETAGGPWFFKAPGI
jgi:hypothetical protein